VFFPLFTETDVALPDTVEKETGPDPEGAVIWLHGLGADGHDFEPIVPELGLPVDLPLRFVFPHAPVRPVTLNGGMAMRAWYDIYSLDRSGPQDEAGIRDSADTLVALVEREKARGIDYDRIVVAGFSQGGAIALHAALRFPQRLAGLLALSTWLPLQATLDEEVTRNEASQPRDLPVFLAHGVLDPVLPINLGRESLSALKDLGFDVEWHEYPMAHGVCPDEIRHIREWLLGVYTGA
jgi:phospholipase/carboxylesterase